MIIKVFIQIKHASSEIKCQHVSHNRGGREQCKFREAGHTYDIYELELLHVNMNADYSHQSVRAQGDESNMKFNNVQIKKKKKKVLPQKKYISLTSSFRFRKDFLGRSNLYCR